jgi:acyl-CoA synthetase (AMP-forming)/AMP-acid ligase II/RNase P protein component
MDGSKSFELGKFFKPAVLSLPAHNSLGFLKQVFDCWAEGQLFAITRSPNALEGLGLDIKQAPALEPQMAGWGRFQHTPKLEDNPAQIVFSSGTEGRPKAILLSHRNLADVVLRLNSIMEITEEVREYIGVPVTYSFGLGRARAVAAAGGAFFLPERFDPLQIRDMLVANEINAISAVPSLWRMILADPEVIGAEGTKVRWIEIGSQYMAAADKLAMRHLFPNARIVQHYGLTEASRTSFLNITDAPEAALESVGTVVGGTELRITQEGAIAIRGDHVALGQIIEGGMIKPLADVDGWLVTQDQGEIREGRLYYLGRLDDQINLAGIKIGAEAIEAEIRALLPAVGEHFAIAPLADSARGEAVLLAIESDADDHAPLIEEAARLALRWRGVQVGQGAGAALKVLRLDQLPRTATNKIQRRDIAQRWQADPATTFTHVSATDSVDLSPDLTKDEARLAGIWARVIGSQNLLPQASFYDAGGDSLSSVQIGLVMEREKLPRAVVRATLEGRSLREAAKLMPSQEKTEARIVVPAKSQAEALPDAVRRSWAITMTRALMALSVVISHWGPGLFERLGLGQQAESVLAVIYRAGTPGFAAVFGIGIGYFMLPDFARKRASVLQRLGASFRLVMMGIVLLAIVKLANMAVRGEGIGGLQIAHAFYGVLGYYALMLGTARWWLPGLARLHHPVLWLLTGLPTLWLLWQIVPVFLPQDQLQSMLEWPRLMLVAGYNVFKLTAVASAGVAVGVWLFWRKDSQKASRLLAVAGALGVALTIMASLEAYGTDVFLLRESFVFTSLPGLVLYLSIAVAGVGIFLALLLVWERLSAALRLPLKLLVVIGGLALPIYVFHGLVIPGRNLLVALGMPSSAALIAAMGAFLIVMSYAGRRLWRMYFS